MQNKWIRFAVEFEYIGDRKQVVDWFKEAVSTFADQCHGDAVVEEYKVRVVSKTIEYTQHADKPQRPSDPEQWEIEQEKEKKIIRAHDSAVERSGT